jgi:hypothetical protein
MSLADKQDSYRIALRQINTQMRGLNPITSSYKKLAERKAKVLHELEQMGAKRTDQTKL